MVAQQWKMEIKTEGTEACKEGRIGGRDHKSVNVNTRYIFLFCFLSLIKFQTFSRTHQSKYFLMFE